jgi:hypothetical protein
MEGEVMATLVSPDAPGDRIASLFALVVGLAGVAALLALAR